MIKIKTRFSARHIPLIIQTSHHKQLCVNSDYKIIFATAFPFFLFFVQSFSKKQSNLLLQIKRKLLEICTVNFAKTLLH